VCGLTPEEVLVAVGIVVVDVVFDLGLKATLVFPAGALCLVLSLACVGCFAVALWVGLPPSVLL